MRPLSLAVLVGMTLLSLPTVQADDPDPPVFKSVTVEAGPYGPGDEVPLQMRWEDASGIKQVHASALGPADLRIHWINCDDPEGERVAVVDCVLNLPERAPGGTYRIDQMTAQDVVGHHTSVTSDATFVVESPFNDRAGPTLVDLQQNLTRLDMETVTQDWGHVRVAQAFFVQAADESNVTYAGLQFEGPNGNSGLWGQCDRVDKTGKAMECSVYADPEIPAGQYVLRNVFLRDEIGYTTFYHYNGWYSKDMKDLAGIVPTPPHIEVATPYTDDDAPVLVGLTFPGRLHRGQPFEVRINATDATAVEQVSVYFRTTRGNAGHYVSTHAACTGEKDADAQLVCTGRFPDNFPLGLALVDWVHINDAGRNWGWLRPVEVNNGWGQPGHHFSDDDAFDVGTILTPRPIEGVVEAIDAVVNEVLPGDIATLVYEVEDTVDDVSFVLEDAADGSTVTVTCAAAVLTQLGTECEFKVPATEDGVLSLVSATTVTDSVAATSTYAAGEVPLIAVSRTIPVPDEMPLATGGGALNTVGHDWAATFEAAKQEAARGTGIGPTSRPPAVVVSAQPATTQDPVSMPASNTYPTSTARPEPEARSWRWGNVTQAEQPPVDTVQLRPGEDSGEEQEAPMPVGAAVFALLLVLAARQRRD